MARWDTRYGIEYDQNETYIEHQLEEIGASDKSFEYDLVAHNGNESTGTVTLSGTSTCPTNSIIQVIIDTANTTAGAIAGMKWRYRFDGGVWSFAIAGTGAAQALLHGINITFAIDATAQQNYVVGDMWTVKCTVGRTLTISHSDANTIYVSKSGSDGNTGTQASPKLNIYVDGSASAVKGAYEKCRTTGISQIAILDSGTYTTPIYNEHFNSGITLFAVSGQKPIISKDWWSSLLSTPHFYVEKTGNDQNDGTVFSPIATLFEALKRVSSSKYIIELGEGDWTDEGILDYYKSVNVVIQSRKNAVINGINLTYGLGTGIKLYGLKIKGDGTGIGLNRTLANDGLIRVDTIHAKWCDFEDLATCIKWSRTGAGAGTAGITFDFAHCTFRRFSDYGIYLSDENTTVNTVYSATQEFESLIFSDTSQGSTAGVPDGSKAPIYIKMAVVAAGSNYDKLFNNCNFYNHHNRVMIYVVVTEISNKAVNTTATACNFSNASSDSATSAGIGLNMAKNGTGGGVATVRYSNYYNIDGALAQVSGTGTSTDTATGNTNLDPMLIQEIGIPSAGSPLCDQRSAISALAAGWDIGIDLNTYALFKSIYPNRIEGIVFKSDPYFKWGVGYLGDTLTVKNCTFKDFLIGFHTRTDSVAFDEAAITNTILEDNIIGFSMDEGQVVSVLSFSSRMGALLGMDNRTSSGVPLLRYCTVTGYKIGAYIRGITGTTFIAYDCLFYNNTTDLVDATSANNQILYSRILTTRNKNPSFAITFSNCVSSDPLFFDVANNDYRLRSIFIDCDIESPLIGMASTTYSHNSQTLNRDIGCYNMARTVYADRWKYFDVNRPVPAGKESIAFGQTMELTTLAGMPFVHSRGFRNTISYVWENITETDKNNLLLLFKTYGQKRNERKIRVYPRKDTMINYFRTYKLLNTAPQYDKEYNFDDLTYLRGFAIDLVEYDNQN